MSRKKVHFIGIGGIGTSALAQYYLAMGWKVSGSDLVSSEITDSLKEKGVKVFIGSHKAKNLPKDIDLIIYSQAVSSNNPELKKAKRLRSKKNKLEIKSYPQALGELTKKYFTIAISGTHGKSTTTAMIGIILEKAGLDPTVILGTKVKEFQNSNCRVGKSKYLVIEADEYKASFLNYWPKIIVLTNIEAEHLDYFKTLKREITIYKKYISHLPKNGVLVINIDNKNTRKIYKEILRRNKNVLPYSIREKISRKIKKILKIPGKHNIANAIASYKVARYLGIKENVIIKSLSQYKGSWRRFEIHLIKIKNKRIFLIHDYAHHPTELRALMESTEEKFKNKKILMVFQPHQKQRTFYLFKDFVKIFQSQNLSKVIITDIYDVKGRENKKKDISSEQLVKAINRKNVIYIPQNKILSYIKKGIKENVILSVGAGDIYYTLKPLEKNR